MEIAPFDNREGFIWMNGEFIKWNDAKCHVITQGLHYASAVFEGERAYKGKIFKSEEHTKRLFRSAEIVGIKIPYSQSQINEAKDELIKKMNFEDCYVGQLHGEGLSKWEFQLLNLILMLQLQCGMIGHHILRSKIEKLAYD